MSATVDRALETVRHQSLAGPPFKVGMCKQQTRLAFMVPSDGSADATTAWGRTRHRGIGRAPRGAIVWWTGGTGGHGHVAISDGAGWCWSVDIRRSGFWDRVPVAEIASSWPALRYVGWSEDIDGVRVIELDPPTPPAPFTPTRVQRARRLLAKALARASGKRAAKIRAGTDKLPRS